MTRLVSRTGLGPLTGIDRVERRYLDHVLTIDAPIFGLCRLATGMALLDRAGLQGLVLRLDGGVPWGAPDIAARLSRSLNPARRRAEADLRRLALRHGWRGRGERQLARLLPAGTLYLNIGHANLFERTVRVLRRVPGLTLAVMIHDAIPLDHPDWQRPGTVDSFAAKLAVAARHADRILVISGETEEAVRRHMGAIGRVPETIRAPLGVVAPTPDPSELPPDLPPKGAYFVALGTIEPRKNHALLLDIWDEMAPRLGADCPTLVVAGRRGWRCEDVFARLDRARAEGRPVIEAPGLTDGAVAVLLQGSNGLLFPSRAEGFGLPPAESALLDVPVVSSPLPSVRETLGNIPIYASPGDMYLWTTIIERLATAGGHGTGTGAAKRPTGIPTWQDHFNTVFTNL